MRKRFAFRVFDIQLTSFAFTYTKTLKINEKHIKNKIKQKTKEKKDSNK